LKLKLEVWRSDHNRHECHFFLPGDGSGYQPDGRYFLGYNPQLINEVQIQRILEILNASVE
jgi:hypothetical protein